MLGGGRREVDESVVVLKLVLFAANMAVYEGFRISNSHQADRMAVEITLVILIADASGLRLE
jgi:hypothetical protein